MDLNFGIISNNSFLFNMIPKFSNYIERNNYLKYCKHVNMVL